MSVVGGFAKGLGVTMKTLVDTVTKGAHTVQYPHEKEEVAPRARGVIALDRMRRIAEHAGADGVLAVATSAVREATNRHEFVDRTRTAHQLATAMTRPRQMAAATTKPTAKNTVS